MRCTTLVRSAFAMIVGCSICTNAALAVNVAANSSGFGLDAHIDALGLDLNAGPLPVGVSGVAPAPYADSGSTLNVNVAGNIPIVVSGVIGADVVTATAQSNVDGGSGVRSTSATGGVVAADIDVNTLPIVGDGITLLGLDGTLSSTAQVVGDYGSLAATGTTTIESLALTISGINVDLSAYVGVNVAPNTSINLAVLGIANASLVLNEQFIAPDNSAIEVNALHLIVDLPAIDANIRLGHSQAQMIAGVPEPASGVLVCFLVAIVRGVRKRRVASLPLQT